MLLRCPQSKKDWSQEIITNLLVQKHLTCQCMSSACQSTARPRPQSPRATPSPPPPTAAQTPESAPPHRGPHMNTPPSHPCHSHYSHPLGHCHFPHWNPPPSDPHLSHLHSSCLLRYCFLSSLCIFFSLLMLLAEWRSKETSVVGKCFSVWSGSARSSWKTLPVFPELHDRKNINKILSCSRHFLQPIVSAWFLFQLKSRTTPPQCDPCSCYSLSWWENGGNRDHTGDVRSSRLSWWENGGTFTCRERPKHHESDERLLSRHPLHLLQHCQHHLLGSSHLIITMTTQAIVLIRQNKSKKTKLWHQPSKAKEGQKFHIPSQKTHNNPRLWAEKNNTNSLRKIFLIE